MCGFLPQPVFRIPEPGQYRNPIYAVLQGVSRMGEGRSKMKESWGGGQSECCVHVCTFVHAAYTTDVCLCAQGNSVCVHTHSLRARLRIELEYQPKRNGHRGPSYRWEGSALGEDGTVQELEWGRAVLLSPSKCQALQVLRSPGSAPPWQPQVAFECGRPTWAKVETGWPPRLCRGLAPAVFPDFLPFL